MKACIMMKYKSGSRENTPEASLSTRVYEIGEVIRNAVRSQQAANPGMTLKEARGAKSVRTLEASILQTVPVIEFITNGDLRGATRAAIESRVASLPRELVEDSNARLNTLLAIADAIPDFKRIAGISSYLKEQAAPIILPELRDGFTLLKEYAGTLNGQLDRSATKDGIVMLNRIVGGMAKEVEVEAVRRSISIAPEPALDALRAIGFSDADMVPFHRLRSVAYEEARHILSDPKRSDFVEGVRTDIAEQKLRKIKKNPAEYSRVIEAVMHREGMQKDKSSAKKADAIVTKDLASGITQEEMLDWISTHVLVNILREQSRNIVSAALAKTPVGDILADPTLAAVNSRQIKDAALRLFEVDDSMQKTQVPSIETVQRKDYFFHVPAEATFGKAQLVPMEWLIDYSKITSQTTVEGFAEQMRRFSSSREIGLNMREEKDKRLELRVNTDRVFSIVGRGAGSEIAGIPLFVLDESSTGITIRHDKQLDGEERGTHKIAKPYGTYRIENSVRLSPYLFTIGDPYVQRLRDATALVANAADTVSGNLERTFISQHGERDVIPVTELDRYIRANLHELLNRPYEGKEVGRGVLKLDYFAMYPPEVRQQVIERYYAAGSLSDGLREELAGRTRAGEMKLSILDISGGYDASGISEIVSSLRINRSAGQIDAYVTSVLEEYAVKKGRMPQKILIVSREGMMSAFQYEHRVLEEAFQGHGITAGITKLEIVQQCIEAHKNHGSALNVPVLDGRIIEPDIVIKLFAYPYGTKYLEDDGVVMPKLPNGMLITPTPQSRKVISDKRINSAILEALRPQLEGMGVEVMPYVEINLPTIITSSTAARAARNIVAFMNENKNGYPEMEYSGAILKIADKLERTDGSEVRSVYPIPGGAMKSKAIEEVFVEERLVQLHKNGARNFVVQPNVMVINVDNEGNAMPKFEVRMIAFSKYHQSPLNGELSGMLRA